MKEMRLVPASPASFFCERLQHLSVWSYWHADASRAEG
jgi:hypothetical protein